jgi:hypothetical protein
MEKNKYVIKNTLGMFDLLKGWMMILMVMAHTYGLFNVVEEYGGFEEFLAAQNPIVLFIILVFVLFGEAAMPALFIASGYGFRKTTFKKCVQKQYKMLIIPYLITMCATTAFHFVYYFLRYRPGGRATTVQTLKLLAGFILGMSNEETYFGVHIGVCGPVWFLLALFIGNVIFNELVNRFEGKMLLIVSVLVSLVGWLLSLGKYLPWTISQSLVAVLYICLGYMAKKNKIFTTVKNPVLRVVAIVVIAAAATVLRVFGEFNMALNAYYFGPATIIVTGLSACLFIYLFLYLNRFKGKVTELVRKIGRLSLYVLCVHTVEIMGMGVYAQYDFVNNFNGNKLTASWIVFGVRLVLVFGGTFLFVWIKDMIARKKEATN